MTDERAIKEAVKSRYAQRAREAGCCDVEPGSCDEDMEPGLFKDLYGPQELQWVSGDANLFSLGCGNPTATAELRPGEVVLDLGSGAGLDVFLSARQVGPTGKAYGLDMTDEMLELARTNQRKLGITNVEFLKGEMEDIPLPDASVDVIISNCVVNLSPDKDSVLREAFRVLKPGGRLAISDIVVRGELPEVLRQGMDAWAGCVSGALSDDEYIAKLGAAGFREINIEPTHVYSLGDIQGKSCWKPLDDLPLDERERAVSRFTSSLVRAHKPA